MGRAINDPEVTHAVVSECDCHGVGVLMWGTQWECYSRAMKGNKAQEGMSCTLTVHPVTKDERGCANVPGAAHEAIMRTITGG